MNKLVSVPSEPQPQKSPETPPPSVPIPSLKKAIAFVNAQERLSTEMLFKTLLVYYKPNQGLFATRRDPQFLTEAIKKGASSQGPVTAETQTRISSAIRSGQFGTRIPENVARALVSKLDTFTEEEAKRNIALVIFNGIFGANPTVLEAAPGKLAMFAQDAHQYIAEAISKGTFGNDTAFLIARGINVGHLGTNTAFLKVLAENLDRFSDEKAQQNIAKAIRDGKFGTESAVLKVVAEHLAVFTDPDAQREIAGAIRDGKFGNDPAVLKAVAGQLRMFQDAHGPIALACRHIDWVIRLGDCGSDHANLKILADEIPELMGENAPLFIAKAISEGKFGKDLEVLKAVAGQLARFTEPVAQRNIAWAIGAGKFGNDTAVLKAVAGQLAMFTDRDAQRDIVEAYCDGKFGNDPEVLKAVAGWLTTLDQGPLPWAPQKIGSALTNIAFAIKIGECGSDTARLKVVVGELDRFTEPVAQRHIAWAIRNGNFGEDPEVLKAVAGQLARFTEPVAQRNIAWAIGAGKFGNDTAVLKAVAGQLAMFTDRDAQLDIAWAIRNGNFGEDPEVLEAVAGKLAIFTDSAAQQCIARAIIRGYFGDNPTVLEAVAGQLAMFTDRDAQVFIADAISNGQFGNNPEVLKAVAGKLPRFTASAAQLQIARAIRIGYFGDNPTVLEAVAGQLAMFTDNDAKEEITHAIRNGKFGTESAVLNVVAGKLAMFTTRNAQWDIAFVINDGIFRTNTARLKAVAGQLAMFTDKDAQLHIVLAISNGRFGTDPTVLEAVAGGLAIFREPAAQLLIADAISNGQFGTDTEGLKVLAEHLPVFTDINAKITLSAAICQGRFGVDAGVLKTLYRRDMVSFKDLMTSHPRMQTALYPEFKFGLTPPSGISEKSPSLPSFFGAKRYPSSEVKAALADKFKDMAEDALEVMCADDAAYAFQIYGDHVVLCEIEESNTWGWAAALIDRFQNASNSNVVRDRKKSVSETSFKGWITSDSPTETALTLEKVDVYNCSVLTEGYPSKMQVSKTHADFGKLPIYLMEAILPKGSFDSYGSKFRHPKTIGFVASTILVPIFQKNPDLGYKMKGIIQLAIEKPEQMVSIASTPAEDGKIKDAINALCAQVAETHDFEGSVMAHFNDMCDDRDKARLAFLLGHIAKKGVLGYHYGDKNQANDLFYSLSKKCFDALKSSKAMVFRDGFHENLATGLCIEILTSNFRSSNSWVHDIFDKN